MANYGPTPSVPAGKQFQFETIIGYHTVTYTPSADMNAGDIAMVGGIPMAANVPIPANTPGTLHFLGGGNAVKDSSVFNQGDRVYWNPTGNPVNGVAGSGAATSTASGNYYMGFAAVGALTGDATVVVQLAAAFGAQSVGGLCGRLNLAQGASTAAAGSTYADAGALPAGTAAVYPTTAANGTKGVIINAADKVTGQLLFIGNGAQAVLNVYGPAGATINGGAANAGFASASAKGVMAYCLSGSGNTWLMW